MLVADVRAAGADAVVVVGGGDVAGRVAAQLRRGGVTADLVVSEGALDPAFTAAAGASAERVVIVAGVLAGDGSDAFAAFRARFRAALREEPGLYAAPAYDATGFLLAAIEGGAATRTAVGSFLATQDHEGVTQPMKFEANGELAGDPVVFENTIEGGQLVGVGPVSA